MKIGIFSDLHLHKHSMFGGADGKRRLSDGLKVLKYIIEFFAKERCDAVAFLGDWFHIRRLIDVEVYDETRKLLKTLPLNKFKYLWALTGNHDWYGPDSNSASIKMLEEFGFTVVTKSYLALDKGLDLLFLPWMSSRDLEMQLNKCKEIVYRDRLLFLHATPVGSSSATGHVFGNGINLAEHSDKFSFIFCGDIHKMQVIEPNIIICGSPMHHNFGDADQDRGVWIYDSNATEPVTFHSLKGQFPEFIIVDNPKHIDDKHYYRITTSDPKNFIDKDNVKVIGTKTTKLKKRVDIDVATSPDKMIEKYAERFGGGLDITELIDLGKRMLHEA